MRQFFTIGSLIVIFQTIFNYNCFSQDWLWALHISGTENIETEAVKTDSENNIIVLTEITGNVTIGSQIFSTQNNEKDILLIKLNKFGTILWTVQIGNTNIDDPKSIYIDANNNTYLTGSFGGTLTLGDITINSTDEKDAFLAKIDSDGNFVWAKNMGQNTGIQKGRKISSDGNYLYVLGIYKESVLLSRAGDTLLDGTNKTNYFLVKYDLDGHLIHARRIYSSSNGILLSNMIYLNDYLYLGGYFSDTLIYDNDTILSNNRSSDFLLMKIDLNGNLVWMNHFGGSESDEMWGLTTDGQNLFVSGYFYQGGSFSVAGQPFSSNGMNDIFLGKIDLNGDFVWAKSNGSTGEERGHELVYTDGYLSVTGTFSNTLNWGNTIVANANTEPFVGTITTDGIYINAIPITVSSSGLNWTYTIIGDNNGHLFVGGKFNSSIIAFNSYISLNNGGNDDAFIAKFGCFDGITINVTDAGCSGPNDGQITATPNEGFGPFTFNWSNGGTTQTISGLNEGDYAVTVSDQSGCSVTATAHITYHPPVSVSTQITQEILCNGDSTGEIVATASDGFPPYSYSWSNGETTTTISNLPAGDYTITVTDQCGNTAVEKVSFKEPDSLDVRLTGNLYNLHSICLVRVVAHASGGTSPYSYEWFDINGNSLGTNSSIWLWADNYYIIVITDANGCVAGWWFYVPGCNKSMDVNDSPELNTSIPYPETDIVLDYGSQPNNNNASKVSQNRGTTSDENAENQIYDIDLVNGLKSLGIGPEINAFPNPADETLNISLEFPYDVNAQIVLLNSMGQIVLPIGWSQTFSYEKTVDVSNLGTGVYYLMIRTDFGVFKKSISIVH